MKSNDPDIRERYIQRCLEKYEQADIINDYETLVSFCKQTLNGTLLREEIIHLHTSLAEKIEKIQLEVDKSLGQYFNGAILWSPQIQVHRDRIDYWHCILRIKMGVLTSKQALKRLSIKIGEYSGQYLTTLACLD